MPDWLKRRSRTKLVHLLWRWLAQSIIKATDKFKRAYRGPKNKAVREVMRKGIFFSNHNPGVVDSTTLDNF